jgi:hypothetical protein
VSNDKPETLRAGIAVDNWKLPVFRRRLRKAGYAYQDGGPLTGDTTLLTVETDNILALKKELERCQSECRRNNP